MTAPLRVVLVDDHRMFRAGVRAELLEAASAGTPVEFVGEAGSVEEALAVAEDAAHYIIHATWKD